MSRTPREQAWEMATRLEDVKDTNRLLVESVVELDARASALNSKYMDVLLENATLVGEIKRLLGQLDKAAERERRSHTLLSMAVAERDEARTGLSSAKRSLADTLPEVLGPKICAQTACMNAAMRNCRFCYAHGSTKLC